MVWACSKTPTLKCLQEDNGHETTRKKRKTEDEVDGCCEQTWKRWDWKERWRMTRRWQLQRPQMTGQAGGKEEDCDDWEPEFIQKVQSIIQETFKTIFLGGNRTFEEHFWNKLKVNRQRTIKHARFKISNMDNRENEAKHLLGTSCDYSQTILVIILYPACFHIRQNAWRNYAFKNIQELPSIQEYSRVRK